MKEQDGNQPFLMCCHFKATHEPHDYPIRMEHLYDGVTFPNPKTCWTGDRKPTAVLSKDRHWKSWNVAGASHHRTPTSGGVATPGLPFSTEGMQRTAARRSFLPKFIRDYLRCGATVDDNIGKLLNALDEMNIADNTIVIYVSDQGYF